MVFTQLLVNSLIMGSIYALVGCGFSLIYATNKFMHFGHGVSVAVSAYALLALFSFAGVPFYLACLLTIILASLFGLGMYKGIYSPLQKRNASNVVLLIASLAIMVFFEFLLQLIFGPDIQSIGYITVAKGIEIFGARITPLQIVIIMVSFALLGILYFFMKKTKLGRNMRAVADNKELAGIVGLNQKKLANFSFMIGSGLAGVAGILIGLEQNLQPLMGTQLMVKGFTGAIIGGVTSVPGAIVGSYLLGIAENYGIWFLPSGYKNAIAFGLLFIFLLFKPSGLFGLNKGVKE